MANLTTTQRKQYAVSILSSSAYNAMTDENKAAIKALTETALASYKLWNANSIFYYESVSSLGM